jgi:hypothetical protein
MNEVVCEICGVEDELGVKGAQIEHRDSKGELWDIMSKDLCSEHVTRLASIGKIVIPENWTTILSKLEKDENL